MNNIIKIALIAIGVIAAVLWYLLPSSDMPATEAADSGALNAMFLMTFILLGIAVVVSLIFSLVNLFSNPANLKKTLFVVVGFALVCVIAYVIADGSDVSVAEMADRGIETSESTIKRIGMGINLFFILTVIAIGAIFWGSIAKATK